eukprot:CAMPEP_0197276324 /NCGR_PEP_ID=MMETSP1432-20130617/15178_1 /TAXON_ID=44447 /ORGANISM="Pseudo-nitzschia delicatissima, Strain UNC1205" /LENGTH=363 /DNA_ID=CAMNT_0042742351 /DNA_START=50 /DNA_END=1141 /DNA_ORIENTATION=+
MVASCKKEYSIMLSLLLVGVFLSVMVARVESFSTMPSIARNHHFVPSSTIQGRCPSAKFDPTNSALFAAGKKKRRRRKQKAEDAPEAKSSSPESPLSTPSATVDASPVSLPSKPSLEPEIVNVEGEEINVADIKSVANFSFDGPASIESPESVDDKAATVMPSIQAEDGAIPLPDIRDTLKRKKMGETPDKGAMEDNMPKTKIDRRDRTALLKLLEQDPYADGDDSFFFEQDYTSISAWLGEGTKPFLGIPTGPLQVGHTIGALVIVLMAFIEYPGFPLTNLPTPLRGALQGGLGTIYGINALLCVVAFFKAQERGQSALIWIAKTLTVGGLALDQLSQLPTTAEVEAAKARKGKRALRNIKK